MRSNTTTTATREFIETDPAELVIGENIRRHIDQDKIDAMAKNIAAAGVRVPLLAYRTADGAISVKDGQLRTLAARQAGVATVPVLVEPEESDTVTRITDQWVANDWDHAMTDLDRSTTVAVLNLDLGQSQASIRKTLGVSKEFVSLSVKTAKSETAATAFERGELTLEQAATVALFDDDPTAQADLLEAHSSYDFRVRAKRLLELRDYRAERAQAITADPELVPADTVLLDERPRTCDELIEVAALRTSDGSTVSTDELPAAELRAWLDQEPVLADRDGQPCDEVDGYDWEALYCGYEIEADPEDPDADKDPRVDGYQIIDMWAVTWYVTASAAADAGLVDGRRAAATGNGGGDPAAQEAAAKEAERARRRKVIALNKLGQAAEDERRKLVRQMLTRKTVPGGAHRLIASVMLSADGRNLLDSGKLPEQLDALIGTDSAAEVAENRAQVLTLATVCAAAEAQLTKSSWQGIYRGRAAIVDYLRWLPDAIGAYELSEIEQVIVGDINADDIEF